MSDLSGRTLFKRIKPLIKVFVIVDSYLPRKLNNFLFVSLRGIGGKVGIVIRYILVKNLAKKCGDNVVIKENVYISNIEKLELGDNISIHPMCYFECSGGLMIGNNVSIAHSSSILTSTHTYSNFNLPIKYNEILKKTVVIHDDVWIGCGVRILCGVHIDTRCIIGANSLVNKSVDSFSIYGGVPAKKIKSFQ
jgi:acetyltransferase-like isoleucine patch superfamily enzyme